MAGHLAIDDGEGESEAGGNDRVADFLGSGEETGEATADL